MPNKLPTLYTKTKLGKIQQWAVWPDGDHVVAEWGQVGGALQTASFKTRPTNEGRSNARTVEEQAVFEAKAMWNHQLERRYSTTPAEAEAPVFLPMLAKDFKVAKNVRYPVDAQPKLDGVRCISSLADDGSIQLMSRGGKDYNVPHIAAALKNVIKDDKNVLDGELYIHGRSCQSTTSLVKRQQSASAEIKYFVYDYPIVEGNSNLTWEERRLKIEALFATINNPNLMLVPTHRCETEGEVWKYQSVFLAEGYEGAIVRLLDGVYEWGHRSGALLKVKNFQDAEYKVIGCREGKGKFEGCAIWACQTDKGQRFDCVPKATFEERQQLFRDQDKYIGKWLKVKFFAVTDDGLPRFPVGIGFRDEADMDPKP